MDTFLLMFPGSRSGRSPASSVLPNLSLNSLRKSWEYPGERLLPLWRPGPVDSEQDAGEEGGGPAEGTGKDGVIVQKDAYTHARAAIASHLRLEDEEAFKYRFFKRTHF